MHATGGFREQGGDPEVHSSTSVTHALLGAVPFDHPWRQKNIYKYLKSFVMHRYIFLSMKVRINMKIKLLQ